MEKKKSKNYYQSNKEKLQERSREYYRNLSEDERIKKGNYASTRNKNSSEADREIKKNI